MSPEAQRIAIAEACGWAPIQNGYFRKGAVTLSANNTLSAGELPNYLSNLNAMHEVEKVLTEEQWAVYNVWLLRLTYNEPLFAATSATAAQRAEAFLRTLNLWDDTK